MPQQRFVITSGEAGRTVAAVLKVRLGHSWSAVRRLVEQGRVRLQGRPCEDAAQRVARGQRLEVRTEGGRQTEPLRGPAGVVIHYADNHVVVVEKPTGLTTMRHAAEAAEFGPRGRRYLPPTLADLLQALLAGGRPDKPPPVRAVHRLDKETSGLVVFARTVDAERDLGRQFRAHTVERRYQAVVRGRARPGRIESYLVADRGDGRRGSSPVPGVGQHAVTHVRVVEELGEYTLVECRLETGRTHQVRIHLGEQGTPLCGERVYDRPLHGRPLPDGSGAPRVALHAASLGFQHPATGERLRWEVPLPRDLSALVKRLRKARGPRKDAGDESGGPTGR
jgi:23S rRNA pseudouridine1911/1915/1917 synthase